MHFYLHLVTVGRPPTIIFIVHKINFGTPRKEATLIVLTRYNLLCRMSKIYFNKASHSRLLSAYVSCELDKRQVIAVKLIKRN